MKKAVKVTQELKDGNPNKFPAVGSIFYGPVPKQIKRIMQSGFESVISYDLREDLQILDGWSVPSVPTLGENEELGPVIEDGEGFTFQVKVLSESEIAAKSIITMPRRDFKMALLELHGITNADVDELFVNLFDNNLASTLEIEGMKIMWYESSIFTNTTPELYQFAATLSAMNPNIDITEEQLKQIFIDYAGA